MLKLLNILAVGLPYILTWNLVTGVSLVLCTLSSKYCVKHSSILLSFSPPTSLRSGFLFLFFRWRTETGMLLDCIKVSAGENWDEDSNLHLLSKLAFSRLLMEKQRFLSAPTALTGVSPSLLLFLSWFFPLLFSLYFLFRDSPSFWLAYQLHLNVNSVLAGPPSLPSLTVNILLYRSEVE